MLQDNLDEAGIRSEQLIALIPVKETNRYLPKMKMNYAMQNAELTLELELMMPNQEMNRALQAILLEDRSVA